MNFSLYSAQAGASSQQRRMDIIANNLANLNTTGFKSRQGTFGELIYNNINAPEGTETNLQNGVGDRVVKADAVFSQGVLLPTESKLDYAINGDGFFALLDPMTQQISYTRSGHFHLSEQPNGTAILVSDSGKYVLDAQGKPNILKDWQDDCNIGVYVFEQKNGMQNIGNSEFMPVAKNGTPKVVTKENLLLQGYLENSNVSFEQELVHMIESQRAYQMNIQMVKTTDDVTATINNLR